MSAKEFRKYIDDLLHDKKLTGKITNYPSHRLSDHTKKAGNGRLDHCLRVSFMCYKIANFLGLNTRKITRAAFLHDCGYGSNETPGMQVIRHSIYGARIARERNEWDAAVLIESHMFPFGKVPKNIEAVILWFVDKADAILDFFHITMPTDYMILC